MTDQINQSDWRTWLAQQLTDIRLSDKEAASVVAWHPSISDEWKAAAPKPATTPPDEMVALELAARNFPDGPGARIRLAMAALNYARAAIAAITEGRG